MRAESGTEPGAGDVVLLVDDSRDARESLALLLELYGFRVALAADGQDALRWARSHPPPRLILLDLMMPGVDGWAFLWLREREPALAGIPVVIISAVSDVGRGGVLEGVEAVEVKPVSPRRILEIVRGYCQPGPPLMLAPATESEISADSADEPSRPENAGEATAVPRTANPIPPSSGEPPDGSQILLVEDEPLIRNMLELGLRYHGFRVWSALDGPEAVDIYRRHGSEIDVVLTNVRLPGLDGPQTVAVLKGLNPNVLFCFMTGGGNDWTLENLTALGAAHVFFKPFGPEVVARTLRRLLQERRVRPG